jgi:hypothetical protein
VVPRPANSPLGAVAAHELAAGALGALGLVDRLLKSELLGPVPAGQEALAADWTPNSEVDAVEEVTAAADVDVLSAGTLSGESCSVTLRVVQGPICSVRAIRPMRLSHRHQRALPSLRPLPDVGPWTTRSVTEHDRSAGIYWRLRGASRLSSTERRLTAGRRWR